MKFIFIYLSVMVLLGGCADAAPLDHKLTSRPLMPKLIGHTDTLINFEKEIEGNPIGFTPTATGKVQSIDWKITSDNGNKVVAQAAKNSGSYFNLLILDAPGYKDFVMSAKIKAVGGDEDQGGGLVWRYADNNNYYVARYNPLENNLRLYKVVDGVRKQLNSQRINILSGQWFTMTIEMKSNRIFCSINGNKLIELSDKTFTSAGRVGFWTKADAQTYFDDLTVDPVKQ
jgi:hypothetical protein